MESISIREIIVKKLFGCFSYIIKNPDLSKPDNLIILYGDNGSGKTTILKLIFFLLSSKDRSGHKTEIAKTKFQEFHVVLNNGYVISAIRSPKCLLGSYKYQISKGSEIIHLVNLRADENQDYSIQVFRDKDDLGREFYKMLEFLKNLNLRLFFLSDTRKAQNTGSIIMNEQELDEPTLRRTYEEDKARRIRKRVNEPEELCLVIKTLENWIKSKVIEASSIGEQRITEIYLEIIKRVNVSNQEDLNFHNNVQELRGTLNEVIQRSVIFSNLGFISDKDYNKILSALKSKDNSKLEMIYLIVEPYIKGLQARLDALSILQQQVSSFIDGFNTYVINKRLKYSIQEGFKVVQDTTEEVIDFENLSSGEKQLLLVFSNVILASSNTSIFIIDEPEISLNIKWQRNLLKTLLDFNSNGRMQFIMATHSIELITKQRENVVKLINKNLIRPKKMITN